MNKQAIIPIKQASNETIKALINAGYLYVDNDGLHVVDVEQPGGERNEL